jgi:aquaporin Z
MKHWREYAMEAAGLGAFMISACVFAALLDHPASAVRQALPDPLLRRALAGGAMGMTLLAIVFSPFGKRSGAHLNPAFTLTFLRLGKIAPADAAGYVAGQVIGGLAGVALMALAWGWVRSAEVNYAVTVPGPLGAATAFWAEAAISFGLMLVVLFTSNHPTLSRYTPLFAALLVAGYITFEAPLSGMSMNPARTLGSAWPAHVWTSLWIYFLAPPLGMLLAAEVYVRLRGAHRVFCAKYHHHNDEPCIFRCRFHQLIGDKP